MVTKISSCRPFIQERRRKNTWSMNADECWISGSILATLCLAGSFILSPCTTTGRRCLRYDVKIVFFSSGLLIASTAARGETFRRRISSHECLCPMMWMKSINWQALNMTNVGYSDATRGILNFPGGFKHVLQSDFFSWVWDVLSDSLLNLSTPFAVARTHGGFHYFYKLLLWPRCSSEGLLQQQLLWTSR